MLRKEEKIVQQVMRKFAGKNASMENTIHKLDFPKVANEVVNRLENLIRQRIIALNSRNGICAYSTCNKYSMNSGFCEEHLKLQPPGI